FPVLRHFRSAFHKDGPPNDPGHGQPLNDSHISNASEVLAAERSQLIVEQGCDAILIVDVGAVIRFANPAAAVVLGRNQTALKGMRLTDVLHPDDVAAALALVTDSYADSAIRPHTEWRISTADGTKRTVDVLLRGLEQAPSVAGVLVHL